MRQPARSNRLEQKSARLPRKSFAIVIVALAALGILLITPTLLPAAAPAAAPDAPAFVDSQLLVRFKPEVGLYRIDQILSEQRLTLNTYIEEIATFHLWSSAPAEAMVEALREMPEVDFAELNYITVGEFHPNDTIYNDPTRVYAPQLISAEAAWDTTTGNDGVVVAVVDSGINATHEDIDGVIPCNGEVCDFVNTDSNPADDEGHGTHVSGILAATMNNATGIAGIAPGIQIMPVKVLNAANTTDYATIAQGIIYAADHGARIINLSLGGWTESDTLRSAVLYAITHGANGRGAIVIAAAGNGSSGSPFYPAVYEEVLAVSSTNRSDQRSSWSNYGSHVDVAAPGEAIWSTYWTKTEPNSYTSLDGTSMSVPHVSGLAALILSAHPTFGAEDVKAIIKQSADDLGTPGPDPYFGSGRINAGAAMALSNGWTQYTPTPTPTSTATPTPPPTATPAFLQRVNAGGSAYTDRSFQSWAADKLFSTGSWGYAAGAAKSSSNAIAGTDEDFLFQKYREGVFEYKFTVPNGTYDVLLKFAEFGVTSSTSRLMVVNFESGARTDTFSVYALAGAKAKALDKYYYTIPVDDGVLNIAFARAAGASKDPDVSAIEVKTGGPTPTPTATFTPTLTPTPSSTPTATNTPTPYAQSVNSGGTTYTDKVGHVWAADKSFRTGSWGYTSGRATSKSNPVTGTEDDLLHQKYREKPVEYKFTVPNGTYEVTLKFAEFVYASPTARNVTISFEGVARETFSVYAQAGLYTALDKTYLVEVTDGLLNIGFARGAGALYDPAVSAIQVRKH